jgi:predicted small lipoprotein YifL
MCKCWANYAFVLVVAILSVGSMLSACGVKGPLYLPPENTTSIKTEQTEKAIDKQTEIDQSQEKQ